MSKLNHQRLSSALEQLAIVIVREDINGAIVSSQILDIAERLASNSDRVIMVVWFYRADYFIRKSQSLHEIRESLRGKRIKLVAIPFVAGRFPIRWWTAPMVVPQWLIGLLFVYIRHRIRFFHCRSYHAAIAASCFGWFFRTKYFFDPRSPLPEENVIARGWKETSMQYRFWKRCEAHLVRRSLATFCISDAFARHFEELSTGASIAVVPNNYPSSFDRPSGTGASAVASDSDELRLAYVGSLGNWNSSDLYAEFLRKFIDVAACPVACSFITPESYHSGLRASLRKWGVSEDIVQIASLAQDKVAEAIAPCTVGIYLMARVDQRLGVKCVEYLAAGLPVAVSANIRGAAELVRDSGVGVVVEPDWSNIEDVVEFTREVNKRRTIWKSNCESLAREKFSVSAVADALSEQYVSAMGNL